MSMNEPSCFFCNPVADRRVDVPWAWSTPRALCPSHKVDLELEDGQLLERALARAAPPDHPLEGSTLAWIFNPVFLEVGAVGKTRAWTDFAAGGMAVFEDRFLARSYFEFRALELAHAVDLLYELRLAAAAGTSATSMKQLATVIAAAENSRPRDAPGPLRGPIEGLVDLSDAWNFQLRLNRVRSSRGHLWPESFVELADWISECSLGPEGLVDSEEPFPSKARRARTTPLSRDDRMSHSMRPEERGSPHSGGGTMSEVSTFRLYLLRATYLLIVVGMGFQIWPGILHHPTDLEHMRGVVRSVLGAVTLLAVLGIRYPIKMLPLLFFELVWKSIWILSFGLPLWSAHQLDPNTGETMQACLMGIVLFPLAIPWRYVLTHYVKAPGDRWRKQIAPVAR